MSEAPNVDDEVKIEILKKEEDPFGSRVENKRQPFQSIIETVTPDNWSLYFPDKPLALDEKRELEEGLLYLGGFC